MEIYILTLRCGTIPLKFALIYNYYSYNIITGHATDFSIIMNTSDNIYTQLIMVIANIDIATI